jgi:hypothetical protein
MNDDSEMVFLQRLAAFQDGSLTPIEMAEFEEALCEAPQQRRLFIETQYRCVEIAEHFRAASFSIDNPSSAITPRRTSRWLIAAGLATAISLLCFQWFLNPIRLANTVQNDRGAQNADIAVDLVRPQGLPDNVFATITYDHGATWGTRRPEFSVSAVGLRAGVRYHLQSGSLRLRMQGGAIVALAAPAQFKGISPTELELVSGKLAARLPDDNCELVVRSMETRVRDLGTAFGITAHPNGEVDLSVFDGSVSVEYAPDVDASEPQTVLEGQSIIVDGATNQNRSVAYLSEQYQDIWPLAIGIDEASSPVEFVRPGPLAPLESLANDHKLLLIPERLNMRLDRDNTLVLLRPGYTWPGPQRDRTTLSATQTISSYLLIYLPKDRMEFLQHSISGTIAFAKPIIGVALGDYALRKSDRLFGIPEIDYESLEMRPLERKPTEEGRLPPDSVRISADRKHLYFNLYVGAGQDNLRVLVDESDAE